MNVQEKVATLEALLARVKKNAGLPRDVRPYYDDGAAFPAIASAGEFAPGASELAALAAPPVIADAIDEAEPMLVEAIEAVDEAEPELVEAVEAIAKAKPGVATPRDAAAERLLQAEAEALTERPRLVALAPPIGMMASANKPPIPDKALERSTEAAKPPARPTAPRPLVTPKPPEMTPAAKVEPAAAARPAERLPPPPPPPVTRVEPPPLPPKPTRPTPRVEPPIFGANAVDRPTDNALPVAAIAVARQEQRSASGLLIPSASDTLPMDHSSSSGEATKPHEPTDRFLGRSLPKIRTVDEDEISSAETKLMVGPLPDGAIPPLGEEATVVEAMPLAAALSQNDDVLAAIQGVRASPLPKLHEPDESDAETQLIPSSRRLANIAFGIPKAAERPIAARADEAAILGRPVPAAGLPPRKEPAGVPDRPAPVPVPVAAQAEEPAFGLPPPVPVEAAPVPPPPPVQAPPGAAARTGNRRSAMLTLGLAAAMLLGSGVFVFGYRSGWFTKVAPPKPSATPSVIRLPPVSPRGSAGAAIPSGSAAAGPGPTPEGSAKVPSSPTGSGAATSPSAVESASAAPITSASAAPIAPTAPSTSASVSAPSGPEGDGSNLPANRGYLLITSAVPASVYANGIFVGLTGQKIDVECGPKYVRLGALAAPGAPPPKPPLITWLSEGRSSTVACKVVTEIKLDARSQ